MDIHRRSSHRYKVAICQNPRPTLFSTPVPTVPSVMSNIAEGFGRGSNEEFIYFLYIAKGSLAELLSQLYLSLDLNYISQGQFQNTKKYCEETAGLLQAFAGKMKTAGKISFRKKRKVIPWREQVQQVMKEIEAASKKKE